MTDADTPRVPDLCGFTIVLPDGAEAPCGKETTGWRWYQDVGHEDALEPACDWHANEGGRRMHEMAVKLGEVEAARDDLAAAERFMNLDRAQAARATADRDKLREQLREAVAHHGVELGKAWRRTEQLRADIRNSINRVRWGRIDEREALEEIGEFLDREPGREEPGKPAEPDHRTSLHERQVGNGIEFWWACSCDPSWSSESYDRTTRAQVDMQDHRRDPAEFPLEPGPAPRALYDIVFPDHIEVDQLNNPQTTIVRLRCLPHTFGPVSSGWVNRGDTHLIKEFVEAHAAHGNVVEHHPDTEEPK
ncbi:hypothetical protein [Amycolatopsis rubida]|uniref:Uncharacterized protein n=1 Tax=Amycolatopsis rubida TaxID=112413 RepID=A0A1I5IHX2_9PSEU|nr:hypothetical protein [Amycolatopsis rubida]SFO60248.1 hypothetical protein SAMN05421854_102486 [Amycolatopsis rubida]